jgi:hypothetical protein
MILFAVTLKLAAQNIVFSVVCVKLVELRITHDNF